MMSFLLPLLMFSQTARADQVQYLPGPKTSLSAFTTSVAQARSSVDIATFIFESCEPSVQVLLEQLAQKARAGVRVRLLLDDFQQKDETKKALVAFLRSAGAQIRFYNPVEPNMRMHLKMMVVDGQSYVAGGRNLSDRYFALSSSLNYVDRDVRVQGASAVQAQAAFDELWKAQLSSDPGAGARFNGWKSVCGDIGARVKQVRDLLNSQSAGLLARAPVRSCPRVKFVVDHPDFSDPRYGGGNIYDENSYMTAYRLTRKATTAQVLGFLKGTRSSLQIENWLYTPMHQLDRTFADLRDRRVKIQVMTNSDVDDGPDIFKEALEYAALVHARRDTVGSEQVLQLSSQGSLSAAHELTPAKAPFFLHSKSMVRDGRDVLVSSFNLDARSFNTNLESAVIVDNCPSLAEDFTANFSGLRSTYARDQASGQVPEKPEASVAAKMFAFFTLGLL